MVRHRNLVRYIRLLKKARYLTGIIPENGVSRTVKEFTVRLFELCEVLF